MNVPPPQNARTLREIRRACGLGPLNLQEVERYWVNTDAARDPEQSMRQAIKRKLDDCEDGEDMRALVCGHVGCGKSTELVKLVKELGGGFLSATFSIRDEMNLTDIKAEDILLVLTERLLSAAVEAKLSVDESLLEPVLDYFRTKTHSVITDRDSDVSLSAEASAGTPGILSGLLKLMAKFKSEIKLDVHSTDSIVSVLRKRPADLLAQINSVVTTIVQALPVDQRLIIIVEDLDKLDIASARRVFIENVNLLTSVRANIIYTIPIFTFHSADAGVLRSQFADFSLPMIKVADWRGQRADGFEVIRSIIFRRLDPSAIEPDAVELLIEKTGGVLRHVFEVLHTAANMDTATVPLGRGPIEYGLRKKRNEFWSEITLPAAKIDNLNSNEQLYDRLVECAKRQLRGEKNVPTSNPADEVLLQSCALVEYNGERWYGVHPLVLDNLRELGRIS